MVNEDMDVDVEKQTEVIRVPQHNDLEAMELMNDFDAVSYINDIFRFHARLNCFVVDPLLAKKHSVIQILR